MDPKLENKEGAHANQNIRESMDSTEHPLSTPIAVLFDVTGSMRAVPKQLVKKLPALLGLLQMKGYVADPQILFGGIGDATCDQVPLQISQFESDNRMDDHLTNMFLEGGGGGQMTESYELGMYFMARHTFLDSIDARGHRGYLFIIGDEMAYPQVKSHEVRQHIGDDLSENISTEAILGELQDKFEVFFIIPQGASHANDSRVIDFWKKLLGQNVIELRDLDTVAETIAMTVGVAEETVTLEQATKDLADVCDPADAECVSSAVSATLG